MLIDERKFVTSREDKCTVEGKIYRFNFKYFGVLFFAMARE